MNIDYLIIANLMSGNGETEKKLNEIKEYFNGKKISFQTIELRKPKRISHIVWDKNVIIEKAVACIGGDGTVSETVGFMLNNKLKIPLAIIPAGTANIFYHTLGISFRSFDFLLENKIIESSIGIAEFDDSVEYFTIGVGIGFSEKYIELTSKVSKKSFGTISYIITAIKELFEIKPIPVTITSTKGSKDRKLVLLLVFNINPVILKIFPLFPFKKISDDKLNIFYLSYHNRIQAFIGTLMCHIMGRYNFHMVRKVNAEEVTLSSPVPCLTQIDGELRGELPIKLSVCKEKLKLLV